MKANEMQRIPPFLSSTSSSFHSPSMTAPNGSKTFPSLSSCHFLWMRHEQRTGVRVRTSFECQNWPREKGALPWGCGGERKKEENGAAEGKKSTPSVPSFPLKKEVDLGQLWSRERERGRVQHWDLIMGEHQPRCPPLPLPRSFATLPQQPTSVKSRTVN